MSQDVSSSIFQHHEYRYDLNGASKNFSPTDLVKTKVYACARSCSGHRNQGISLAECYQYRQESVSQYRVECEIDLSAVSCGLAVVWSSKNRKAFFGFLCGGSSVEGSWFSVAVIWWRQRGLFEERKTWRSLRKKIRREAQGPGSP